MTRVSASGLLLLIGRHGRWRDGSRTVLGYVRDVDRWTHNPMNGTDL